ncbi:MAG: hypothetical protein ACE5JG_01060, partial [Planctomycetota bacterium]
RARTRLRLTVSSLEDETGVSDRTVAGLPARVLRFRARHRGESLEGLLCVVRTPGRYLILVGASPDRLWRWSAPLVESILGSVRLVP